MRWWLMKSEPDEFGLDDLERDGQTLWSGVRNYQARNFMRDEMRVGDGVFLYHSSCPQPGIAGLGRVAAPAAPDPSQFDPRSPYHDPASRPDQPRWVAVTVAFAARAPRLLPLAEIRRDPALAELLLLRRGQRLSIQPVEERHASRLLTLARLAPLR
jgi:predicted RNA-binding protein with PUA-like domain